MLKICTNKYDKWGPTYREVLFYGLGPNPKMVCLVCIDLDLWLKRIKGNS